MAVVQLQKSKNMRKRLRQSRDRRPYVPPVDSDLEHLLRSHAVQSSMLANQLAMSESSMIDFAGSGKCDRPDTMLEAVQAMEKIRKSALDDIRRSAITIKELRQPPLALAARLMEDGAEIAVGPTPRQLQEPPTEQDLTNAYGGADVRRQLQQHMRS